MKITWIKPKITFLNVASDVIDLFAKNQDIVQLNILVERTIGLAVLYIGEHVERLKNVIKIV